MPTALVGAGISAVGGLLSNRSSNSANERAAAAAEFNPFDISGGGGNVSFGPDGTANVTGDANSQMFQNLFANQGQNLLGGNAANQGAINFGNQLGNNFGQFFNEAGVAGDPSSAVNAGNMFSNFSAQNAQFGQQAGANSLGLSQGFGTQQGGFNEGIAQSLFGQGQQAFNNTDFSGLAANQLQRSRSLARPAEERAVNSKFQNLFNRGTLSATSGQRQLGDLAFAQEQADITRQFGADQFANQLGQQNRQFGLGLFNQGLGARQQDLSGNLQRASLFGQQGQGLLNFGQGAGQQGFNTQLATNNLVNSRGQQRLSNATQLFGFGQQAQNQNFNQATQSFANVSQGNADLRNLVALGGNLGSASASAGANQGAFLSQTGGSPAGSFLESIGSSSFFNS